MFSPFERLVAGRYLRSKKQESFVSVIAGFSFLGIMLGVATLIIVMSVMNGFRQELLSSILQLNGHMNVYAQNRPFTEYDAVRHVLDDIEGVELALPVIDGQALLSVEGSASGALIQGVAPDDIEKKPILKDALIAGQFKDFNENRVFIGAEMASRIGAGLGSKVTLVAPKGKASPFGTIPRSRSYTVAGIFDVGMFEYNSNYIFMPMDAASRFFRMKDTVSSIEVFTDRPYDLDPIKKRISIATDGRVAVSDWRDSNGQLVNALQVERNVMFLILTLIIIVAAFNIISSMIMLVKDKGQDIAIMRTMGATRRSILKIFILTGASIGFIGTFLGAVLGIAFAQNIETIRQLLESMTGKELFAAEIYFLSQLPAVIDWSEVTSVILMALCLSILATLYPAWRAAKLDPVEALRNE